MLLRCGLTIFHEVRVKRCPLQMEWGDSFTLDIRRIYYFCCFSMRILPIFREQHLHIHLLYCIPHSEAIAEVNLTRPLDELFWQTCDKIKGKVNKFIHKQPGKVACDKSEISEFVFSAPDHSNLVSYTLPVRFE